jgi:hypothetical protein
VPYVVCGSCGTSTYATRPYARAAECGVCGSPLVDSRLAARPALRPWPATTNGAGGIAGDALGGRQKSRLPADDKGAALAEH